ncbi:phosphoribosyltransferase [Hoeflea sp. WL0058]|uniref:Phosphoribosyltransferase n=1 Tax=Flavimaribacter sediminis TaxID=2865987 RepID=A0AAE3D2F1_9HYPH|nr:phosphoribosyltransferase [Flavimaribacter sediminis]MBW8639037.1 phosphoribosyltransferase [Flavimaribacter sediminis]
MIHYNKICGWMGFSELSVSAGLTYTYAIAYRLKDRSGENWTNRFNRFKNKDNKAEWGGATVLYDAVPPLIKYLKVKPDRTLFIPALSSGEEQADPGRSIPWIAKECARICDAGYNDTVLSKQVHGKIHNLYSAEERSAELAKANYQCRQLDADHVFIFDDLITRGDTLSHIALAVLETNPKCRVYGIAFGKNESVDYCPNPDNDHVPEKWDRLWKKGEMEHDAKYKKG